MKNNYNLILSQPDLCLKKGMIVIMADKNVDYSGFSPYDNFNFDPNMNDPMFNPMLQYEQAYMYYRYLCMQLDYKIKCKEYERLNSRDNRKIE